MSAERIYFVLSSRINGTLYIGVTNNLIALVARRSFPIASHSRTVIPGLTRNHRSLRVR